ncbi:MAG: hypothetical protein ACLQUY_22185 [Ktedonobacterales bacterium]
MTPGLSRLVGILRRAGLNAHISNNISKYLTTHAALVGRLIVQHDCGTYALARSRVDLTLLIDGLRVVLDVLRITGHTIVPRSSSLVRYIPRGVLEVGAERHCSQAPDEMQQLANELNSLVKKSGLPVPAIRKILAMGQPHAGLHFVAMLAAWPARDKVLNGSTVSRIHGSHGGTHSLPGFMSMAIWGKHTMRHNDTEQIERVLAEMSR